MMGRCPRSTKWLSALLVTLLLPESRLAANGLPLKVTALLEVLDMDDHAIVTEPGAVLCSRERFRLEVEVSQRSYIWVAQGRDGRATVIYPPFESDPDRLEPGASHLIPDGAIELDDRRGVEQVIVVACRRMLARSELVQMVAAALVGISLPTKPTKERVCTTGTTVPQGQLAPEGSHERYRDLVLRQRLKQERAGDAALLRIPIIHR